MRPKPPPASEVPNRLFQDASEAWQRGDHPAYFEAMRRAARQDPTNFAILLDTGVAHASLYDYPSAEACFERVVSMAADKFAALERIALLCRNFNRYDFAARFLERAAGRPEATADTFTKLAEMYERLRRPDDARRLVERALRLDASNALALLVRARLERTAGRLEDAERTARSFLNRSDANTWSTRIRGWYELGAILDRQARYDEALSAVLAAKALIRPQAAKSILIQQRVQARLAVAAREISADVLRRWADAAQEDSGSDRIAVIGGHPRSGTTLLEQVLDSHPDVASAEETSIFFDTYVSLCRNQPADAGMLEALASASPEAVRQARIWYFHALRSFLGRSADGRLMIDKNPSLTALTHALVRLLPGVRLIVALRDPRDVCLSCFMQALPLNSVSSSYLSLADTAVEYSSVMGFWQALAPRLPEGMALEVRYEDVVRDVEAAARRALGFLGLNWDARVLRFDDHARRKLVRSPTYSDVARPITQTAIGRWRHYSKWLEPCLESLAPFLTAFGYND